MLVYSKSRSNKGDKKRQKFAGDFFMKSNKYCIFVILVFNTIGKCRGMDKDFNLDFLEEFEEDEHAYYLPELIEIDTLEEFEEILNSEELAH